MNILIVYSTLSGSTLAASDLIASVLKKAGHGVTQQTADAVQSDTVSSFDGLIVGSPSWEDEGKDGQPLPEVRKFVESLDTASLIGKRVGLFGLGDTSYPHFCGAVDVLEELLTSKHVTPVLPSLKIDRFYSSPDNEKLVMEWAIQYGKS